MSCRCDELYGNEANPHEKWGEKPINTLKKHTCNSKNFGPRVYKKPT
jgi:hypothetical protein